MNDIYYPVAHRNQAEIDSFKTRYQDFDNTPIPEIFKQSLGLTATSWKPSDSWGSAHVIYFVQTKEQSEPLVLRANTGFGEPEMVMLTEKLITDRVLEIGLPTNRILYVDSSRKHFPFDFQIQEIVEGMDPEVDFPDGQTEYDQLSFELGQYIAQLQQLTFSGFGRFDETGALSGRLNGTKATMHDYVVVCLEADLKYLVEAKVIDTRKATTIENVFDHNKELLNIAQGSLVHHDLADHNLTYKAGHLSAVFDWETAVIGDPVLDLASCPTWGTLYPREKKLLEGFTSISSLPENFEEKRNVYVLRTVLWKTAYVIRANILTDARKQRFYTALEPFKL